MNITPESMKTYFVEIDKFSKKFPLLRVQDVNFMELAKHLGHPPLEMMSAVVLLDALKTMNQNSETSFFIDMEQVKKIKVQKKGNTWHYVFITKENKQMKIKHVFS